MVSVIIPCRNEVSTGYLPKMIASFKKVSDLEILFVLSRSNDGTEEYLQEQGYTPIICEASSRAARLNQGIRKATNEMLLLHHPRSFVDPNGLEYLKNSVSTLSWGGFTHGFDVYHPLLSFTSWYSNNVRARKSGILYLDHCIFLRKDLLGERLIPDVDIFEDTELSLMLLEKDSPKILPFSSTTSAVRFQKNGVYRQAFMNQVLKVGYNLNVPHEIMNKIYERGLSLNNKY